MPTAFSENADFGNILESDLIDVNISDVIHMTHIELDKNGTKAAAVTAVMLAGNAYMEEKETVEITLDRPFVYAIVDDASGLPVFLGTVNSVAK